jgi:hypothetical protein
VRRHKAETALELGVTRERVPEGPRDAREIARQQNNSVAMLATLRESAEISGY